MSEPAQRTGRAPRGVLGSVPCLPDTVQSSALIPAILDLGFGEAEAIALGLEHPGSLLIIDDRLARRMASVNQLTCTNPLPSSVSARSAAAVFDGHG